MTKEQYTDICDKLRIIIQGTDFEGHLFAVGGCCRDLRMGRPIKDIDLVIDLPDGGIRFTKWMEASGNTEGTVITYPTYGTAMFYFNGIPLECVQTRKEQYHDKDSRNPETAYGTIIEDAMRRDLTINALYYDITNDKYLDPTDKGIKDIEDKVIRVTSDPDTVYSDDPLRILRTIRFASRYRWDIEKETYEGMKRNAYRLVIISKERIQSELNNMLLSDNPRMALENLRNVGAMEHIIPELTKTYDLRQNKYHNFDTVWEHTLDVVEGLAGSNDLVLLVAALLHDIGKIYTVSTDDKGNVHFYQHEAVSAEMCKDILRQLKYSNDFIDDVVFFVANHMAVTQWNDDISKVKLKSLRKLEYKCGTFERFIQLMRLVHSDNMSCAEEFRCNDKDGQILVAVRKTMHNGTAMFGYKLPVSGFDIMNCKGIKPGKTVKKYLDHLLKIAYSRPNMTKEDCLKDIRNINL